ncbi:ATP-binding protein [Propionibacteriaceae bacterium Y1685]|uniref:ATP-binding protein n=1 Tax=Microlunatus sp. Y1700 TaxID=3418487 RepID=UPI003B76C72A
MTEVPLLPGYSDATVQWRAESLQSVNWGGFHGYSNVDFAPASTLISGASGTGKSTLLDAVIALMMPSTVPFNGASNDATTGRARGTDQRNLLTYLRGKRDDAPEGDVVTDQVLRGGSAPIWGAVAMTFVDDNERRFTALRTYYVPVNAQRSADVSMKMFTVGGAFDLRDLADFADARFDPRAMRTHFSGLTYHDTVAKFTDTMTSRLGIGANGDGDKALRLLARIQAGHQVKTVDSLYKQMVLEKPRTYEAADRALSQFHDLDQSYRDLETDDDKKRILDPIAELHGEFVSARDNADRLDRFGVSRNDKQTPFRLWHLRTEYQLLAEAEETNKSLREGARESLNTAKEKAAALGVRIKEIEEEQRANGGGALERIAARIVEAQARRQKVREQVIRFGVRAKVLGLDHLDEKVFADLRAAASQFLPKVFEQEAALTADRDLHIEAAPALKSRRATLQEEHTSLKRRDGRVPMGHDKARNEIARACGLRPADLPFAAELMDVDPDYEDWRLAAEVTLRGIGLTMLMDERRQKHIRESIDGLRLDQRITFEGVDLATKATTPTDTRMISGRLTFKDESPFVGWVKARVSQRHTDHLCVHHPSELGGDDPKVTVHGQVSRGRRGAHGWNRDQKSILGFSNASRLSEIEGEVQQITVELAEHERSRKHLEDQVSQLRARAEAYRAVMDCDWESLDLAGAEAQIEQLETERATLLEKSDLLLTLQRSHDETSASLATAQEEQFAAKARLTEAEKARDLIVDHQDEVSTEQDELERGGTVVLRQEDADRLTAALSAAQPEARHDNFREASYRLKTQLAQESTRERDRARRLSEQLVGVFERYNEKWPDPNRGSGVESYPEFATIYDEIVRNGLYQRRQTFKRHFQQYSGRDLISLKDAYEVSLTDIEERLDPVNDILDDLPFGAQHDRLKIVMRRLHPEALTEFRRQLRDLTANVAVDWTDDQMDERFHRLREFMDHLAKPESGSTAQRDDLLDVRRHIEITASRINAQGKEISTYSALGGKSGGESQELVAFIVGAALRYQLGDETRTRPRFAPVFLDEGFVKADGEFAGRAVKAWRGLGFQLIIGAPLDKVTALEPHMELNIAVTKNQTTGYSYVSRFSDASGAA